MRQSQKLSMSGLIGNVFHYKNVLFYWQIWYDGKSRYSQIQTGHRVWPVVGWHETSCSEASSQDRLTFCSFYSSSSLINPYNMYNDELFLYKPRRLKLFFQFEIIINVLVSSFQFIWICYESTAITGLAKSHARTPGPTISPRWATSSCLFLSLMLSSPVARKVIWATKHNKDLSTPASEIFFSNAANDFIHQNLMSSEL